MAPRSNATGGPAGPDEDVRFQAWVSAVFAHPVTEPRWYWDIDRVDEEPPARVATEYLARLFNNPEKILSDYSDAQIAQGLWYLNDMSCSNYTALARESTVSTETRCSLIRAHYHLFSKLFARRCSGRLLGTDTSGSDDSSTGSELDGICYMWWDLSGLNPPQLSDYTDDLFVVFSKILLLQNETCQESALHGLGHVAYKYENWVTETVDRFLREGRQISPALRSYAMRARRGHVQ